MNFISLKNVSVGATATDSLSAGYRTVLIDDCCRGVDLQDIESTKETVLGNHGIIVSSKEVKSFFIYHPIPQKPQNIGHSTYIVRHLLHNDTANHDFSILINDTWFKFNCLTYFLYSLCCRWKQWWKDVIEDLNSDLSSQWSWKMPRVKNSEERGKFKFMQLKKKCSWNVYAFHLATYLSTYSLFRFSFFFV